LEKNRANHTDGSKQDADRKRVSCVCCFSYKAPTKEKRIEPESCVRRDEYQEADQESDSSDCQKACPSHDS
jgi:hypothetical protein